MRPILLLEINEVPLRVWKKYAADARYPAISCLLRESKFLETRLDEVGELSPWCTWPTFHRGLSKKDHGILHLGQDPATFRGTPIWEEFLRHGRPVGVFGSMQSWPPVSPGLGGFYVPDTFSADSSCIPEYLEPVQAFNLLQVRKNARVMASKAIEKPPALRLLLAMLRSGVKLRTFFRIASQLLAERISPQKKERRVTFQALLFWDIFCNLFDPESPPAFTTFFSNHVASVMHRYWNHIFPDDFPEGTKPQDCVHVHTMDFAMGLVEKIVSEALEWRKQNPALILLVANSMGQGPILRQNHEGFELLLSEPLKLISRIMPGVVVRQNLAMVPQVSLEFNSESEALSAAALINSFSLPTGVEPLFADAKGRSLNISCHTPSAKDLAAGVVLFQGSRLNLEEVGMSRVSVSPGTAYHVPEGMILVHGLSNETKVPEKIPTKQAKELILEWSGLLK